MDVKVKNCSKLEINQNRANNRKGEEAMKVLVRAIVFGLIVFLTSNQQVLAYDGSLPNCPDNSNYDTVDACCPPDTDYVCIGTTRYWGCFVTSDFLPITGKYSCQCWNRANDSLCTNPPSPENDIYIYDESFPSLVAGQSFCLDLRLKNGNSSSSVCYSITDTKVESSGVSVSWTDNIDSHDYTLCGGDYEWVNDFCGTPSTNGTVTFTVKVKIDGTYYSVDSFNTGVSPGTCTNDCLNGEVGCNGTSQSWTCGESGDGDSCLEKIYSDCSSGYSCSNGACLPIQVNNPPVLYGPMFIDNVFYIAYFDYEGDPVQYIGMFLLDNLQNQIGTYDLTWYVGSLYQEDFSWLADGTYYYQVVASDGINLGYYPEIWGNYDYFIKANCNNECSIDQIGCSSTTQQWSCGEAGDGDPCLEKLYTNCSSGYSCSSGSCLQILPPNPPVLSASVSTASSGQNYTLSWTATGSAYRVDESQSPSFTSYLSWSNGFTTQIFSHQPSSTTTYYYRVLATDPSTGLTSNPSNIVSVTVNAACISDCIPEQMGCDGSATVTKCQLDTDGCYHLLGWQTCNAGYSCSNGSCIKDCSNECSAGETGCNGSSQSWSCGEAGDNDSCLERIYINCFPGFSCSNGSCIQNPPPMAPTLSISTNQVQNNESYTASWTNTGVGSEIQEATNSGFSGASGWSQAGTSKTFSHNVATQTIYYYRVRAMDSYGVYSSWSNTQSVTVLACVNDCIPEQMGCDGSATVTKCQLDTDGCYHLLGWQTCNAGYSCSNGSCVKNNSAPILSDWYLDPAANIFYCTVSDPDGDSIKWFYIFLYTVPGWQYYNYYTLSPSSGSDTLTGVEYSKNFDFLAAGTYGYFLSVGDTNNNQTQYPGNGQMPTFDICHPDWQCEDWSSCYYPNPAPPGYLTIDWLQKRSCADVSACSDQVTWEYQFCDCNYTSIEWEEPLAAIDGEIVLFTVTWTGNCSGDNLFVKTEETTWVNGDERIFEIEVDPQGMLDGQEVFATEAYFVSAPTFFGFYEGEPQFSVTLMRRNYDLDGNISYSKIISSANRLVTKSRYSPEDAETVEDAIRASMLGNICDPSVTISNECYEYFDAMNVQTWEDRQMDTVFEVMDWGWKGSCVACTATGLSVESWSLLGPASFAAAASSRIYPAAILIGAASCEICIPFPSGFGTEIKMAMSEMAVESKLLSRVDELADLGISSEYKPVKNGGYVNYVDDEGRLITEVYGISSLEADSLTFYKKIPAIPVEVLENYKIIDVNRNVVPIGLGKFQAQNLALGVKDGEANMKAFNSMFADDMFKMEVEYAWDVFTNKKVNLRSGISKIEPVIKISDPELHGAHGAYYPSDKRIEILVTAREFIGSDGQIIPLSEMTLYYTIPHELGHGATFELIIKFKDPTGKLYQIITPVQGETYWASEFFNDVSYLYSIQDDTFRRTMYLNSIYAWIDDIGIDNYANRVVQFLRAGEYNHAQYYYLVANEADSLFAQKVIQAIQSDGIMSVDDFLWKNDQIYNDAIALHNDMVVMPGFDATSDMNEILVRYKFVADNSIPPPPPPPPTPKPNDNPGLGSGSDSGGSINCTVISSNLATNPLSDIVLLIFPAIVILIRRRWRK